jgi:hypothetical protein
MMSPDVLRDALAAVLEREPLLSWRGFWERRHDVNEPLGTLERVRRETLDDYGLAQFSRAMAFLAIAPKTKALNRHHGCYGWKHSAERWHRVHAPHADYYIGEGAFIAACIASGMTIYRGRCANLTNLSQRAWTMGEMGASV